MYKTILKRGLSLVLVVMFVSSFSFSYAFSGFGSSRTQSNNNFSNIGFGSLFDWSSLWGNSFWGGSSTNKSIGNTTGSKAKADTKSTSKTRAITDTKASSKTKATTDTKAFSKTKANTDTKASSKTRANTDTKASSKTKANTSTKSNTTSKLIINTYQSSNCLVNVDTEFENIDLTVKNTTPTSNNDQLKKQITFTVNTTSTEAQQFAHILFWPYLYNEASDYSIVDWGDNTKERLDSSTQIHQLNIPFEVSIRMDNYCFALQHAYSKPGTYTVTISSTADINQFNNVIPSNDNSNFNITSLDISYITTLQYIGDFPTHGKIITFRTTNDVLFKEAQAAAEAKKDSNTEDNEDENSNDVGKDIDDENIDDEDIDDQNIDDQNIDDEDIDDQNIDDENIDTKRGTELADSINTKYSSPSGDITYIDIVKFATNIFLAYTVNDFEGPQTYTNIRSMAILSTLHYTLNDVGPINIVPATLNGNKNVYLVSLAGVSVVEGQATNIIDALISGYEIEGDYVNAVRSAMLDSIPQGSDVILTGISLGGMTAQQIAGDSTIKSNFNILNTVAVASPVISPDKTEGTVTLIQDQTDIIPTVGVTEMLNLPYSKKINISSENGGYKTTASAHTLSYVQSDVWANYDVLGVKGGSNTISFNGSDVKSFEAPSTTEITDSIEKIKNKTCTLLKDENNCKSMQKFFENTDFSWITDSLNTKNLNDLINLIKTKDTSELEASLNAQEMALVTVFLNTSYANDIIETIESEEVKAIFHSIGKLDLDALDAVIASIDPDALADLLASIDSEALLSAGSSLDLDELTSLSNSSGLTNALENFNLKDISSFFGQLGTIDFSRLSSNFSSSKSGSAITNILSDIDTDAAIRLINGLDKNALIKFLKSIDTNDIEIITGYDCSSDISSAIEAISLADRLSFLTNLLGGSSRLSSLSGLFGSGSGSSLFGGSSIMRMFW